MREAFENILAGYPTARNEDLAGHPIANLIRRELPENLATSLGLSADRYQVSGSSGIGGWAQVPWVNVMDRRITTSPTKGAYIVYLFRADGAGVYVSLNQGWTYYKETFGSATGRENARKVAAWWRSRLDVAAGLSETELDLASVVDNARGYEAAHIIGKYYPAADLPTDAELEADLRSMLDAYQQLVGALAVSGQNFEDFNRAIYVDSQLVDDSEITEDTDTEESTELDKIIAGDATVALSESARPTTARDITPTGNFKPRKTDFEKRQRTASRLGLIGEKAVLAYEKAALEQAGRPDLAKKVHHLSVKEGDGAGYDIRSYFEDGREKYVEVKTTSRDSTEPFMVSENEVLFSEQHAENYVLYRVFSFSRSTRQAEFYTLAGSLRSGAELSPTQYAGFPSPPTEAS